MQLGRRSLAFGRWEHVGGRQEEDNVLNEASVPEQPEADSQFLALSAFSSAGDRFSGLAIGGSAALGFALIPELLAFG